MRLQRLQLILITGAFALLPSLVNLFTGEFVFTNTIAPVVFLILAIIYFVALKKNAAFAEELKSSLPEQSEIYVDNDFQDTIPSNKIDLAHIIRVQTGANIPVDGIVTFGSSFVEEKHLLGTHNPRMVGQGAYVFAGSTVKNSPILIKPSSRFHDSFVYNLIIQLNTKTKLGIIKTLSLLLLCFFINLIAGFYHTNNSLVIFNIAPLFVLAAGLIEILQMRKSSGLGFAWRNQNRLLDFDTVVLQKDSLQERKLRITKSIGMNENSLLRLLGPLARRVENAKAFCVLHELRTRNIPLEMLEVPFDGKNTCSGTIGAEDVTWLEEANDVPAEWNNDLNECLGNDESFVFLKINDKIAGALSFKAETKKGVDSFVQYLQNVGKELILCHDRKFEASTIAQKLNIQHVSEPTESLWRELNLKTKPIFVGTLPAPMASIAPAPAHSANLQFYGESFSHLSQAIQLLHAWQLKQKILLWSFRIIFACLLIIPAANIYLFLAFFALSLALIFI